MLYASALCLNNRIVPHRKRGEESGERERKRRRSRRKGEYSIHFMLQNSSLIPQIMDPFLEFTDSYCFYLSCLP